MSDADCPCGHNVEEHEDHTGCAQCTCLRLPSEVAANLRQQRDDARTLAVALENEVARLKEALEWYADEDNYDACHSAGRRGVLLEWVFDRGARARAALSADQPAPTTGDES